MTDAELKALCQEWQKVLRLQDWNIDVRFGRHHEMEGWGKTTFSDPCYRMAHTLVLHPDDVKPDDRAFCDFDAEQTLVHELVHVKLCDGVDDTMSRDVHRAVEEIADALIAMKRQK